MGVLFAIMSLEIAKFLIQEKPTPTQRNVSYLYVDVVAGCYLMIVN
jgi:hypothetical protein